MKPKSKKKQLKTKSVPKRVKRPSREQADLTELTLKTLTKTSSTHAIFLVRQGLTRRTEQFIALAKSSSDALHFCRHFLTPKYCAENQRQSLRYDLGDETPKVNFTNDHLLIKGIDFKRTEMGRTNQNPLWYLVIAQVSIVHKTKARKKAKNAKK